MQEGRWRPRWLSGKEPTCQCRRCRRHGFDPWAGKLPWRRAWRPTPGLARRIPWTEEPGVLQFTGPQSRTRLSTRVYLLTVAPGRLSQMQRCGHLDQTILSPGGCVWTVVLRPHPWSLPTGCHAQHYLLVGASQSTSSHCHTCPGGQNHRWWGHCTPALHLVHPTQSSRAAPPEPGCPNLRASFHSLLPLS